MRKQFIIGCSVFALAACTAAQLADSSAAVQAACNTTLVASAGAASVVKGGALNTVTNLSSYAAASCSTAEAIAKLASDPSSIAWLQGIADQLNALKAAAK